MKILFWIIIGLIVHVYCIYPLILLSLRKFMKIKFRKSNGLLPVTIIVSAYNEEDVIETKIGNLLDLDYPKKCLEIIIASDGSYDRTNEIVKRYASKGIRLAGYRIRRGKAETLNRTIPKAKNEIIVLSDANAFFKKDAIQKLVRNFGDVRVGAVCGRLCFDNNGNNKKIGELEGFYWKYETFLKRIEGSRGSLLGANGAIYAIRKSLFTPVPSDTIVEDFLIPMKILEKDYKVLYEPEAIAYEETAKGIVQEMARRVRIGAGDFQSLFLTWRLLNPLHGFSSFAFWSHKVLRWVAPFLLTGVLFLNAFLVGENIYLMLFLAQSSFYLVALLGRVLSNTRIHIRLFGFCYYFVSMNIALLLGFFKFFMGRQSVMWDRTHR